MILKQFTTNGTSIKQAVVHMRTDTMEERTDREDAILDGWSIVVLCVWR